MSYGRWCFWIHASPEGSKISRYETLKQVEKSTGKMPKDLQNAPTFPEEACYAWKAYTSLSKHTWTELASYIDITKIALEVWECEAVMELAKYREARPQWPLK